MEKLFRGKRAFVTGGGSGIGRACALALAAEGCFVTVAGRTEDTLHDTVRLAVEAGGSAQAVRCDVTVEPMVRSAVAAAANDGGRLDVAVNSAGYEGSAAMAPAHATPPPGDCETLGSKRGQTCSGVGRVREPTP